ncbi:hypothetical protein lerEdw1_009987, partial [Lerista edwardsae]
IMYDQVSSALNTILRMLLAKEPTLKHLHSILGEIMEEFADHTMGSFIYRSCMDTIAVLSKFKCGMGSKLESKVLQLALNRTIDWGLRRQDVCNKIMYHQASSALNTMLGMLLAEDPTLKHLETILGHFTAFLNAEDPETQVEALIMAGSLERLAARCGIYYMPLVLMITGSTLPQCVPETISPQLSLGAVSVSKRSMEEEILLVIRSGVVVLGVIRNMCA